MLADGSLMDLSSPSRWHTWSGNALTGIGTGAPPLPAMGNDGRGDWQRHVTHQTFHTPTTVSGWFEWVANRDPSYPWAGVVVGLTQDNDHGYHLNIRADGVLQLLVERDGYGRLTTDVDHPIRPGDGVRHQFTVTFADTIVAEVDGIQIAEDAGTHVRKGWPRYRTGRVGLRLDRQHVRLGSIVVKGF